MVIKHIAGARLMAAGDPFRLQVKRENHPKAPPIDAQISVDGINLGKVAPNGSTFVDTTEGEHELTVGFIHGIRTSAKVVFTPGDWLFIKSKLGKIEFEIKKSKK